MITAPIRDKTISHKNEKRIRGVNGTRFTGLYFMQRKYVIL